MAITTLNEMPDARSSRLVLRNCCTKRGHTSKSEKPLKPGIKVCLLRLISTCTGAVVVKCFSIFLGIDILRGGCFALFGSSPFFIRLLVSACPLLVLGIAAAKNMRTIQRRVGHKVNIIGFRCRQNFVDGFTRGCANRTRRQPAISIRVVRRYYV